MAISNKILSQVPAEDEFSSTSSRHILVEDGGIIKRLNKAGLKELPVVTSEDSGKVVIVDDEGNYVLKKIDTNYIVDITFGPNNTAISDKTYEEILDAIKSGKRVVFTQQGKFFGYASLYTSLHSSRISAVKVNVTGNAGTPVSGRLPEIDMITYWSTGTIETYSYILNPSPFVVIFSGNDEDNTSACDTLWDTVNENKQNAVFMYDSGEVTYQLMPHYDETHVWANSALSPDSWIYCSIESGGTVSCVIENLK